MTVVEESLPAENPGFFRFLLDVIIHPRRAFTALRETNNRSWLIMAGLLVLFTLLPVVVAAPITSRIAAESIREALEAQSEAGQALPPETQQQATQIATNPIFTIVFPGVGAVIGLVFSWLIWSGALHLLSTIMGGSNSFGQMWRAVVWAWLPVAIRGLLQTLFILITGEVITNPGLSGLVADQRSIAEIVARPPSTGQMVLQSLLGRVELFTIWNLVLLVIAVWATARLSARKSSLITLGLWLLFTLLGLIPVVISAMLSSGFSG